MSQSKTPKGSQQNTTQAEGGPQTGMNRGPHIVPNAKGMHNTIPPQVAYEGSVSTRTPEGEEQGITTHSQSEESARQRKVVKDRPDATASLNHNRKKAG